MMTNRTWIIFVTVIVVLFGGLIYAATQGRVNVDTIDERKIQAAQETSGNIADHVYGAKDSKVVLIEYGDFQCPGCGSAHEPLTTVKEKYKDQLTFIYRNFPLTQSHPNARAAAAAAEAAGIMGKYWEMHDKLFENQSAWESASTNDRMVIFTKYAGEIGIDTAEFEKTLENRNSDINQKINFDTALGRKIGVSGTPAIYVNGKHIDQRVKDGKLTTDSGGSSVWANADDFDKLILQPAFKEAGIDVSSLQKEVKAEE